MLMRSGKIRFLFWCSAFALFVYLWIIILGVQAFVFAEHPSQESVTVIVILYILFIGSVVAGTIVAALIGNRFYISLFGLFAVIALGTILLAKSLWG